MKASILLFGLAIAVAACDAQDPLANDANKIGEPADIQTLPPDERVDTPANEPANGVTNSATVDQAGKPIPASMHGRWALTPGDCTSTRGDAKGLLTISAKELRFYEAVAVPAANVATSDNSVEGIFNFTGEGQNWTSRQMLQVQGDKLMRKQSDPPTNLTYTRCANA
jgi:hypothetical protein